MKKWLGTSHVDILTFFETLHAWMQTCQTEYRKSRSDAAEKTPVIMQTDMWDRVTRRIHYYPLKETMEQLRVATKELEDELTTNKPRSQCTDVYTTVHGRPCKHCLMKLIEANPTGALQMEDFDHHWWIRRDPNSMPENERQRIRDFVVIQRNRSSNVLQGRRGGGIRGTRREPIRAERQDRNHRASPPPQLSSMVTQIQNQQNASFHEPAESQPFQPSSQQISPPLLFQQSSNYLFLASNSQPYSSPYSQPYTSPYSQPYSSSYPQPSSSQDNYIRANIPARSWGYAGHYQP